MSHVALAEKIQAEALRRLAAQSAPPTYRLDFGAMVKVDEPVIVLLCDALPASLYEGRGCDDDENGLSYCVHQPIEGSPERTERLALREADQMIETMLRAAWNLHHKKQTAASTPKEPE